MSKPFTFATVCSGIGSPEEAWKMLGWKQAFCSEIEKFPSAVLAHHHPEIPNLGDFTAIGDEYAGAVDLLVAGTPCQDFSVAGLRAGVAGERGNLTLEFLRLAQRLRVKWLVWENVPGVFSSTSYTITDPSALGVDPTGRRIWQDVLADEAHAFSCFLAGLQELGYGFAYRVLDAQYLGVPQRRRRVFVVGHLGDWRRAAAVLFERHSLSGYPPPRREAGQGTTHDLAPSLTGSGSGRGVERSGESRGQDPVVAVCPTIRAGGNRTGGDRPPWTDVDTCDSLIPVCMSTGQSSAEIGIGIGTTLNCNHEAPIVAAPLTGKPYADNESQEDKLIVTHALRGEGFDASEDGTGRGTPIVAIAFDTTLITSKTCRSNPQPGDPCHTLSGEAHPPAIAFRNAGDGVSFQEGDRTAPLDTGTDRTTHVVVLPINDAATRHAGTDGSGNNAGKAHGLGIGGPNDPMFTLTKGDKHSLMQGMAVRRLTPRECERLQGFPDDYTKISAKTADGPRYKALGNSMAVPVMRWIGERIAAVEALA